MKRLLDFTLKLKHLDRTGWKRKNIKNPETVASHSYQMAMMALYLSKDYASLYDFDKVIKLCLCHDLAESVIGDITPSDKAYKNKKIKEMEVMNKLSCDCDYSELYDLFVEYENNETKEAKLANDLDKLDMYVQSIDYEKKNPDLDLEEFRISARKAISTPIVEEILKSLEK